VTAGVLLAGFALCALAALIQLYRSRDREASSGGIVGLAERHLGWLFDAEEGYERLVATHFTWYYGSPVEEPEPAAAPSQGLGAVPRLGCPLRLCEAGRQPACLDA
jgi:hypothetical protein